MIYLNTATGIFQSRPNRFISHILINGQDEVCHVKNTGRCKELLVPGAKVVLEKSNSHTRKTSCSIIGVYKGTRFINMDSQAPNKVFAEFLKSGNFIDDITYIKNEAVYKNSRFDFYCETKDRKIFIEIKGVTLEKDGVVYFPDAPTARGLKHIEELIDCMENGYDAYMVFVIQMSDILYFTPNMSTHPEFGKALMEARKKGVNIRAFDCIASENSLQINKEIYINLDTSKIQVPQNS